MKRNKNQRSVENELLIEWFIYVVESIGEEKKADEQTMKKIIKKIENYQGLNFFEVQAIVNDFISKIEK